MYMTKEDCEYFEQVFNSLDHDKSHDFLDLLNEASRKKSGTDAFVIHVRDQAEITQKGIDQHLIITREMIESAQKAVKGGE